MDEPLDRSDGPAEHLLALYDELDQLPVDGRRLNLLGLNRNEFARIAQYISLVLAVVFGVGTILMLAVSIGAVLAFGAFSLMMVVVGRVFQGMQNDFLFTETRRTDLLNKIEELKAGSRPLDPPPEQLGHDD